MTRRSRSRKGRPGITLVESVVLLLVVSLLLLTILAALPRRREAARLSDCRRNLMQIGRALALYDRAEGALPFVPTLPAVSEAGPLKAMLDGLGVPDFLAIEGRDGAGKPAAGAPVPAAGRVAGFLCLSDPNVALADHPSPVSYRACTGDDAAGRNGAFAPGRPMTLREVESADGRAFTAGFAERLLGGGSSGRKGPGDYGVAPLTENQDACPPLTADSMRGDSGSSWIEAGWQSTLYNHALTPQAGPSCIGEDGKFALMGASSGHVEGVNVLILDGSVRTIRPSIAPPVWKALGTTHSPRAIEP